MVVTASVMIHNTSCSNESTQKIRRKHSRSYTPCDGCRLDLTVRRHPFWSCSNAERYMDPRIAINTPPHARAIWSLEMAYGEG